MLTILYNINHDNNVTEEYIKALLVIMLIIGYGTNMLMISIGPKYGKRPRTLEYFMKLFIWFFLTIFFTCYKEISFFYAIYLS